MPGGGGAMATYVVLTRLTPGSVSGSAATAASAPPPLPSRPGRDVDGRAVGAVQVPDRRMSPRHPKRSIPRAVRTRKPVHPGRGADELEALVWPEGRVPVRGCVTGSA